MSVHVHSLIPTFNDPTIGLSLPLLFFLGFEGSSCEWAWGSVVAVAVAVIVIVAIAF